MNALSVKGLCKSYPSFTLSDVSFEIAPGSITGFIGRNGAGKTTTLKSLLNLVHPDAGEILFWDKSFAENELEIKHRLGFAAGGISYYPTKKLRAITAVTRRFYPTWDDGAYRRYMELFKLDERKTPGQLSEGMKVKYSLALALSHKAGLLILDEPTSGLDPVSRDELLDVFLELVADGELSILFSTHITSDLDKCADHIVYIKNGKILDRGKIEDFLAKYRAVKLPGEPDAALSPLLVGCKRERTGYSAIIRAEDIPAGLETAPADLETVMIHMEKD